LAAKARPIWSVALPAAKGTMALIGLFGYGWASATVLKSTAPDNTARQREAKRMEISFFGFGGRV
jgi:hypothetical protein